jgi:TRAP-type C4-dicarboxylate transport system permease small subunit
MNIPILEQINSISQFEVQTDLGAYVSNFVSLLLTVSALGAFAYLVWGGFNWIISSGDKVKVEEARNRITNAIIGLAIVASSWAVFLLVDYFFGLNLAQ